MALKKARLDSIIKLIEKNNIIRQNEIVLKLKKKISRQTILNYLKELEKQELIESIKYPLNKEYGRESEDKKAVYYILASRSEQVRYYNAVIKALNSKNPQQREKALVEIEDIQGILLQRSQLTELSNTLTKENEKNTYYILKIIDTHFRDYIFPTNLEIFQKNLVKCFEKYNKIETSDADNLKSLILFFLGILGNKKIIDFLKRDIKESHGVINNIINRYSHWTLSKVINENKADLFEFYVTLPEKKSKAVMEIRNKAQSNETSFNRNRELFERELAKWGYRI